MRCLNTGTLAAAAALITALDLFRDLQLTVITAFGEGQDDTLAVSITASSHCMCVPSHSLLRLSGHEANGVS